MLVGSAAVRLAWRLDSTCKIPSYIVHAHAHASCACTCPAACRVSSNPCVLQKRIQSGTFSFEAEPSWLPVLRLGSQPSRRARPRRHGERRSTLRDTTTGSKSAYIGRFSDYGLWIYVVWRGGDQSLLLRQPASTAHTSRIRQGCDRYPTTQPFQPRRCVRRGSD